MTIKDVLHSKKFWTLVTAIVAALAAFFLGSCTARHYVVQSASSIKSGDTTRTTITYEQIGNFKRP
nr:MAG TPA: chitin synthase regulator [Microviridae sp.]